MDTTEPAAHETAANGYEKTHYGSHTGHGMHAGHAMPDREPKHHGHDAHAGHSVGMFRDKFWVSLLLTLPTLVWGHMLQRAFGYTAPHFPGSDWIPAAFGTVVFAYGGWVFIQGAAREMKARLPGMMTLISLAISVAFVFSAVVTLGYPGMPLWEELATLVTIMLLGHWIEMRSVSQAQGALRALAKLLPDTAVRVVGDRTEEVAVDQLRNGERTVVAGIMRLVEQAQASRSRAQDLADRAAFILTLVAIGAGLITLIAWLALRSGEPAFAVQRVVTVLVIACPHALGLAIPLVVAISTTQAAQSGLLVRNRRGLEEARNLNAVVFDKTGTLTKGEFGVIDIATTDGLASDDALRFAAAVEADSEHTIAQGIVRGAQERGIDVPRAEGFEAIPGKGAKASVDGRELYVGGPALLAARSLELPPALREAADRAAHRAQASIFLADDRKVIAMFAVADVVRPESKEAVRALHDRNVEVVMMTGDVRPVAEAVAAELGIDSVFAEVLPEQKASKIEELKRRGKRVAMVGDGVNDAPALVTADVGIAIGAGTDVAVEAGDIVLVRSDPRDVPRIIALSRATYRKMIQNLWWAAGYNIIAIPLAAGLLAGYGFVLSPAIGAVLMSASTVVVAINAQLLRRARV